VAASQALDLLSLPSPLLSHAHTHAHARTHSLNARSSSSVGAAQVATPLRSVRQFEGGQSNPTFWLQDANGGEFVLRKKPPGKLLRSAHAVEREYRVIQGMDACCVGWCAQVSVAGLVAVLARSRLPACKSPSIRSLSCTLAVALFRVFSARTVTPQRCATHVCRCRRRSSSARRVR
jgi:Phosphotransferase enzyme family